MIPDLEKLVKCFVEYDELPEQEWIDRYDGMLAQLRATLGVREHPTDDPTSLLRTAMAHYLRRGKILSWLPNRCAVCGAAWVGSTTCPNCSNAQS